MRNTFSRVLLAGTALSCLGLAAPASAQQASDDPNLVIVTARRLDERLQDVPISITVFNQEQLSQRNIVNAERPGDLHAVDVGQQQASAREVQLRHPWLRPGNRHRAVGGVYFADVVAPRAPRTDLRPATARAPAASSTCRTCRC